MIYLNSITVASEPDNAGSLAAHEFAHLLTYYHSYMLDADPARTLPVTWLDEGIAMYAEHLAGYDGRTNSLLLSFTSAPDVNFTDWDGSASDYGAAYAFVSYLVARKGQDFLTALVSRPLDGEAGINAVLQERGSFDTFDSLLDDWILADFLAGHPPIAPPFSFSGITVAAQPQVESGPYPRVGGGSVANFGATYVDFPVCSTDAAFSLVLDGDAGAPLHAALISWDSAGLKFPWVGYFNLSSGAAGWQGDRSPGLRQAYPGRLGTRLGGDRRAVRLPLQCRAGSTGGGPIPRHWRR